jgi:hypothetical protein
MNQLKHAALIARVQQQRLYDVTLERDVLIRRVIELGLTVAVLEDRLRAVDGVRQGTDEKQQLRVN